MRLFADACGVWPFQHSSTVFGECRDLLCSQVIQNLHAAGKASPYNTISIDKKAAMMLVSVTFISSTCEKASTPLPSENLAGMEASDLFAAVKSIDGTSLDPRKLLAFTADGASVNGSRRANLRDGNHVAGRLQAYLWPSLASAALLWLKPLYLGFPKI